MNTTRCFSIVSCLSILGFTGCHTSSDAPSGATDGDRGDTFVDSNTDRQQSGDAGTDTEIECSLDSNPDAGQGGDGGPCGGTDGCSDTTADTDAANLERGGEWQFSALPSADEPNLLPASVSLYIPEGISRVRAAVVFAYHGLGEDEYAEELWRASAKKLGVALILVELKADDGKDCAYDFPNQAAHFLLRIFETAARKSCHTELAHVPFLHWGHSNGGFLGTVMSAFVPERTVGFIGFHGSIRQNILHNESEIRDAVFSEAFVHVPGLIIMADEDGENIKDSSIELSREGRKLDAQWTLAIQKDAGHWDVEGSREFAVAFAEELFEQRIPAEGCRYTAPPGLNRLAAQDGWIGILKHHREFEDDEERGIEIIDKAEICPAVENAGNDEDEVWLVSESFARLWLAFELM